MGILSSLMLTRSHHLFFPRNASKASTEGDDTAEDFFFLLRFLRFPFAVKFSASSS